MAADMLDKQILIIVSVQAESREKRVRGCALVPLCPEYHPPAPPGSVNSSTPVELGAREHGRDERRREKERERAGWESLIELLFQVWIYSTDPALEHTPAAAHRNTHTHSGEDTHAQRKCLHTHARTHSMLRSSLESSVKALKQSRQQSPSALWVTLGSDTCRAVCIKPAGPIPVHLSVPRRVSAAMTDPEAGIVL